MRVLFFLRGWTSLHSAPATVKGYVGFVVHDDCLVHVNVGDADGVHVHDGGVVEERSATPFAAAKARAAVSKAVVNPAVEANMRSPVAAIPCVDSVIPTPVAGGPQQARLRHFNPRAGNPVITVIVVPCPISGSPHKTLSRADRLFVNRQRRRFDSDGNVDADRELRRRLGRKEDRNH